MEFLIVNVKSVLRGSFFHEFARRAAEAVKRAHGKSFTVAFLLDKTICIIKENFAAGMQQRMLCIKQLVLHGILYFGGCDHKADNGEAKALELKLRDKLGIS